jgi:hypothetical protein
MEEEVQGFNAIYNGNELVVRVDLDTFYDFVEDENLDFTRELYDGLNFYQTSFKGRVIYCLQ